MNRGMKEKVIEMITARKTSFGIIRRWKPNDEATSVKHNTQLMNIGTVHNIAHLQLLVIMLILTERIPEPFRKLRSATLVSKLG